MVAPLSCFPFSAVLFSSVFALAVNLRFPVLEWDSEVRIVKQSAASVLGGLGGTLLPLLGLVAGIASFERETIVVTWITGICGGLAAAKAGFLLLHWQSTVVAIIAGAALAALGMKYQYSQIRKHPPKKKNKTQQKQKTERA